MEIGTIDEKLQQDRINGATEFEQPREYDHNRIWEAFDSESLVESKDIYILSSDCGAGKTTLLRHLQLEILQTTNFIPIFLDARDIEDWKFKKIGQFAEKLAEDIEISLDKNKIIPFLEEAFDGGNIFLLVDGLDQIKGGAGEYEPLARRIIEVIRANVIIASRPSAVVALESEDDVSFLRLQPFSRDMQKDYFGEHYERARKLSANAPDLVAIPMLAYMVRTLIEKGKDKGVKNRAGLYGEFIKYVLTDYRHGGRQLPPGLRNEIRMNLRKISYYALNEKDRHIQRIPLEYYSEKYDEGKVTIKLEEIDKLAQSGLVNLIVESAGDLLYFTHTSFQEYLAAEWASRSEERIQSILKEVWNPKWREVIKFLAGLPGFLGEDFIKKIYSPGYDDNCIYSRLFLAAECCGETEHVCGLEEAVFEQLRRLVSESPFEEDATRSLSRLNSPEAIDFLVNMAVGTIEHIPGATISKDTSIAQSIFLDVETKVRREHIDRLLSVLKANDTMCYAGILMLRKLVESLVDEDMDRIINLERLGKFGMLSDYHSWTYLGSKLSSPHIHHIFETIARDKDENVRLRFLRLLSDLTHVHLELSKLGKKTKYVCGCKCDGVGVIFPRDLGLGFSPKYIEILINCAKDGSLEVQEKVCEIMTNLAGRERKLLRPCHIDWIINMLKTGRGNCERTIIRQLPVFFDRLPSTQRNKILDFFLNYGKGGVHQFGLWSLYLPWDKVPAKELAKIISILDGTDTGAKLIVLEILRIADCKLNTDQAGQLDKIIDLLTTRDWRLLNATIITLGCFVNDMRSRDIDKILEAFDRINSDFEYDSIIKLKRRIKGPHRGSSYCPVPTDLPESHIKRIAGWLNDPCGFKQKLAIELLGSVDLSVDLRETCTQAITNLLPEARGDVQVRGDVVEIALRALPLIHGHFFSPDINKIINCLGILHYKAREAAIWYLTERKEDLSKPHANRLIGFLGCGHKGVTEDAAHMLAEIPNLVPGKAIDRIMDMAENDTGYGISSEVPKFARQFKRRHVDRVLGWLRTGKATLKRVAIKTLREMPEILKKDGELSQEIIKFIERRDKDLRYQAQWFFESISQDLGRDQVEMIINSYANNPTDRYFCAIIGTIPPKLLREHVDALLDILNQRELEVQTVVMVLDILAHLTSELQPHHIKQVEKLLSSPEKQVRKQGYWVLKRIYASSGLPA